MDIRCPYCQQSLEAKNVNISKALAKCENCNKAFQISNNLSSKPTLDTVNGISISHLGNELIIERKWFSRLAYFLIFFCVVWDGFLVFWYQISFKDPSSPWIMKVLPIGHLAVGFGLSYFTLCLLVNKTKILISRGQLQIKHEPLPWRGSGTLMTKDIQQIFVKRKVSTNDGSTTITFDVVAKLHQLPNRKIASGISDYEQALKIEQEIEKKLGITDQKIPEEYQPDRGY